MALKLIRVTDWNGTLGSYGRNCHQMHGAPRVMACGTSDRAKDWVQHLLTDLQGTLAQGLCLPVTSAFPVEDSQVVEGGGHLQGES